MKNIDSFKDTADLSSHLLLVSVSLLVLSSSMTESICAVGAIPTLHGSVKVNHCSHASNKDFISER